jgi:hypothetical protein
MLPRLQLKPEEIDDFLRFMLSEIAFRPDEINIEECATVSRYLDWLSWAGIPTALVAAGPLARSAYLRSSKGKSDEIARFNVDRIAKIIWGNALQYASFEPSDKTTALAFLKKQSQTYLANPYFESAFAFVEEFDIPADAPRRFGRPGLISPSINQQSPSKFEDDLADRIVSARSALQRAGVRKCTPRVAQALNAKGIKFDKRGASYARKWHWEAVRAWIKRHRKRQLELARELGMDEAQAERWFIDNRERRVDHWIHSFRFARGMSNRQNRPLMPKVRGIHVGRFTTIRLAY